MGNGIRRKENDGSGGRETIGLGNQRNEDGVTKPIEKTTSERQILSGLLGLGLLILSACGGGSSSSGPPPPLPNGQTGSLVAPVNSSPANCYISDTAACSSTSTSGPVGANAITALAAATFGTSTNVLYWGDGGGNLYFSSSSHTTTPPTISSSSNKCTVAPSASIQSLAVVPSSPSPLLFYATSGGVYEGALTASTGACTSFSSSLIPSSLTGALAYSNGLIVGVTAGAQYFTCTTTSPISCTPRGTLPSLVDTSPQITAIGADPQYAIVYVLAIGVNTSRVYFYQVGTNGVLNPIGNYTGTELINPSAIALFVGKTGTSNFCTLGPCTFMDVANAGNTTVTQYVLTYSGPSTGTPTGVSINQFNNAYYNCDLINPSAIAAFPLPGSSGTLNTPEVFVGENGLSSASSSGPPCFGLSSGSFGNNITAYNVKNE